MPNALTSPLGIPAWFALICLASARFASADGPRAGTTPPPAPAEKSAEKRTLDDELLDGLGVADPLADLEAASKPKTSRADKSVTETGDRSVDGPPTTDHAKKSPAGDIDDELLRGLGEGEDVTFDSGANPLTRLNQRMRDVQQRIADAKSDGETQRLEQDIARELADLIQRSEQACRACQKAGGSPTGRKIAEQPGRQPANPSETAGNQSDQPARESSAQLRKQKTTPIDPAERQELLKDVWGHLPAHLRQQMEQLANEEFLPQYSLEIADYYRALVDRRRRK